MNKYILGLILVFVLSYSCVSAIGDIDPNVDTNECISLVNNLRYRDRDANKNGEVSTLQDFLQVKGYLNTEPTGYFGLLTFKAVKDFQNTNNITPVSGYVGPLTRAKIKALTCGNTPPLTFKNPVTHIFANPQNVITGGVSTITWWSTDAISCVGTGGTSGWASSKVASTNPTTQNVTVSVPTIFTLTCTGAQGTTPSTVTTTIGISDPFTAPQCGIEMNTCITGNVSDIGSNSTSYTWRCNRTNGNFLSCSKTKTSAPTVKTTITMQTVSSNHAIGGGSIISNGGAVIPLGSSGVVWNTSINPTTANSKSTDGWSSGGPWLSAISNLTPNTTYYLRAYATNSAGTGYGENVTFTTKLGDTSQNIPVITFSANPSTISSGQSSTLQWSVSNATSCTATGDWTGTKAATTSMNQQSTGVLTSSKRYTLTCVNSVNNQSATKTVDVTVSAVPAPISAPTIFITPRNPGGIISYNTSAWINWMSYNSTSCTLSADNQVITTTFFSSANPTFSYGNAGGSKEVGPLTKSTTYTIKCEGPGGVTTKQETLEVEPAPTFCLNGKIEPIKNEDGKVISYSCINENMPSWYGFSRASFFDSEVTNSSSISFQNYMLLEGDDVVAGETIYILVSNQNDRNIKIYSNSSSQSIQEISLDYYKNGKYIAAYQIPERVGEKIYFTSNNKKSTVLNIIPKVSDMDKVKLGLLWRTKQGNVVETIKKSSEGIYLSSRAPYSGTWRVYKKDTNELVKEFSDGEIISSGPSHNRSHPYTTFEYISRALFNPPSSGEYYFTIETGIKGVTTTYNVYRSSNLMVGVD